MLNKEYVVSIYLLLQQMGQLRYVFDITWICRQKRGCSDM